MILTQPLVQALDAALKDASPGDHRIQSIVRVAGGDINRAYCLITQQHRYFVKINGDDSAFSMFLTEKRGLELLQKATDAGHFPETLAAGYAKNDAFLLMHWIDAGDKQQAGAQEALGRVLASLHQRQTDRFGLDHDNYIGRLPQINAQAANWTAFFIERRLQKQLDMAGYRIGAGLKTQFERLFRRLPELYPSERPSLLHGDFWGGNYLIDTVGRPILIDPAPYYGHREMDIAMTMLFGGFSERFYAAYQEAFPLQPGWKSRVNLWNLYPLLVHFNLFGDNYLNQLKAYIKAYI